MDVVVPAIYGLIDDSGKVREPLSCRFNQKLSPVADFVLEVGFPTPTKGIQHTVSLWTRRQFFVLLRDPAKLPREQEVRYRRERGQLSAMVSGCCAKAPAAGLSATTWTSS